MTVRADGLRGPLLGVSSLGVEQEEFATREESTTMDAYDVELEPVEPDGFAVTVPALPGLLVLGATIDEVLARARDSIAFHVRGHGKGQLTERIAVVPHTDSGAAGGPSSASRS